MFCAVAIIYYGAWRYAAILWGRFMSGALVFAELLIFHGLVIAWGIWEYRKTDALHKRTLEQERARQNKETAG